MSSNKYLLSTGAPYFQLAQSDLTDMSMYGIFGDMTQGDFLDGREFSMSASLSIRALPVALASVDEVHPFMSFQYASGVSLWSPILEFGITPSGKYAITSYVSGSEYVSYTTAGSASAGPAWSFVTATYVGQTGDMFIYNSGGASGYVGSDGGGVTSSPNSETMRLVLFNGAGLLSKTSLAIRTASMKWVAGAGNTAASVPTWVFSEGRGETVAGTVEGYPLTINPSLRAESVSPSGLVSPPWGDTAQTLGSSMRWVNATEWTHRSRPVTAWAKAGIS